jgi:hypothetical protein
MKTIKTLILMIACLVFSSTMAQVSNVDTIVTINKTVEKLNYNTFIVRIKIERGELDKDLYPGLKTFFQIQYDVPFGLYIAGLDAHGGVFEFSKNVITYTWMDLPKEMIIETIFKVEKPIPVFNTVIRGTYYYLIDEEKQIFNLPDIVIY